MAGNVQLSPKLKKLSKDFQLKEGLYALSPDKMEKWGGELEKTPDADRPKLATELIALALKFQREGGEATATAAAQLYFLAAGLMRPQQTKAGKAAPPKPRPSAPRPRGSAPKKTAGGWGAKKR
jgi:hypothetical protein